MNALPYYKSLDGIRGIAVLMVVLVHSHLMPIGRVGVQIFFVLSGFLITAILLTQTDRPLLVYLRRFYWRRGLRIWPLYFLFLSLCMAGYACVRIPETWPGARAWLVTFTYNLASTSPHFSDSDYFGHFWTLCVEEQFYLVWPFVVFLLPLKQFRRFVVLVVLAGPLIRCFTGLIFAGRFDNLLDIERCIRNLTTSHLDAFACGALIAVAPEDWARRLAPKAVPIFFLVLTLTIIAGLAQSLALWQHNLPPHWQSLGYGSLEYFYQDIWAYSLLNLTSAALIFCALRDNAISRILAFRPLVYIGTISYGLYVWHLPFRRIFAVNWQVEDHSLIGLTRFLIYFLITLGVASLSYFYFEKYFLKMKKLTLGAVLKGSRAAKPGISTLLPGQPAPPSTGSRLHPNDH